MVEEKEKQEQEAKDNQVVLDAKRQLVSTTNIFSLFSPEELLAFEALFWVLLDSSSKMPLTS